MRPPYMLALILVLALLLRLPFLPWDTRPIGHTLGNIDEASSYTYMTYVALTKDLFVGTIDEAERENLGFRGPIDFITAYHPPLYYVLGANILLLTTAFTLPEQILLLKLFSVFLGVGGILFSYLAIKNVFGEKTATVTTFFLAIWPTHVFLSTVLNNYALVLFLYPLLVYLAFRNWDKAFRIRKIAALAVLSGALALTQLTTLTSVPFMLAVFLAKDWKKRPLQKTTRNALLYLGILMAPVAMFMLFLKKNFGIYLPGTLLFAELMHLPDQLLRYANGSFDCFFNMWVWIASPPSVLFYLLVPFALAALAGLGFLFRERKKLPRIQQGFLLAGGLAFATMVFFQLGYEALLQGFYCFGRRFFDFLPIAPAFFVIGLDAFARKTGIQKGLLYVPVSLIFLAFLAHHYFL